MKTRYFQAMFALLFLLTSGCEDSLYNHQDFTPEPVDWTLTSGKASRYQWRIQQGRFVPKRPPMMAYATSFSEKFNFDDDLEADFVPVDDLQLSQEGKDLIDYLFRDPPPEKMEPILDLEKNSLVGENGFALSLDGTRLVVISSDGRSLILYDTSEGRRIGSMKLPGDWSQAAPEAVLFCGSTQDFMVASSQQAVRISASDGKITGSASGWQSTIKKMQIDWEDQSLLIFTTEGELFLGKADLSDFSRIETGGDRFVDAALTADGLRLIGATQKNQPRLLNVKEGRITNDRTFAHDSWGLDNSTRVVGAKIAEAWMNQNSLMIHREGKVKRGLMFWRCRLAVPCDTGWDWFLVAGQRLVNQEKQNILFSFQPRNYYFSAPVVIDELPNRLIADKVGERVAWYDSRGLHLARRPSFESLASGDFWWRCDKLIVHQPLEQIEKAYLACGRQRRFAKGNAPSYWQSSLLRQVGYWWNKIEGKLENGEEVPEHERLALKRFQDWWNEGGVLAKTVNAFRQDRLGWEARGNGSASTVTESGWEVFREKTRLSIQEIESFIDQDDVPALAYNVYFSNVFRKQRDIESIDPIMRKATEAYPADESIPLSIAILLLPQWGGGEGDAFAFVAAHADLHSGRFSDILYMRLIDQLIPSNQNLFQRRGSVEWRSIDADRIVRGIKSISDLRWPVLDSEYIHTWFLDLLGRRDGLNVVLRHVMRRAAILPADVYSIDLKPHVKKHFAEAGFEN